MALTATMLLMGASSPPVRSAVASAPWSKNEGLAFHEVARLPGKGATYALAWSADGTRLAELNLWDAVVYDARDWSVIARRQVIQRPYGGKSIAFLSNDEILVGGDRLNTDGRARKPHGLTVWNIHAPEPAGYLPVRPDDRRPDGFFDQDTFAVSPDRSRVVSTDTNGNDRALFIFDRVTGLLDSVVEVPHGLAPPPQFEPPSPEPKVIADNGTALAFAPGGHQAAVCTDLGMIHLLDVASGHVMATIQAFREGVSCSSLAYSADGELLASGREGLKFKPLGRQPLPGDKLELEDNTGGVFIWSTSDHRKLAFIKEFIGSINDIAWSPREDVLAVADDVSLRLWSVEPESGAMTQVAWVGVPTFRVAFSPDGRLATIPIRDSALHVYAPSR